MKDLIPSSTCSLHTMAFNMEKMLLNRIYRRSSVQCSKYSSNFSQEELVMRKNMLNLMTTHISFVHIIGQGMTLLQNEHRKPDPKLWNQFTTGNLFQNKNNQDRERQIITRASRCFLVVSCNSDDLVLLKFAHFKEIAYKLNKFLRTFQTNAFMLPYLVHVIEKILREICSWFKLDSIVDGCVKS